MSTNARPACIIICARRGYVRQARGLVSRALRKAKIPFDRGDYMSEREAAAYGMQDPRYTIDMTDEQARLFSQTVREMAAVEGWSHGIPVDMYHD